MQNFDTGPAATAGDPATPTPIWTSPAGTSTAQNCPTPASGGLLQLAVDAFTNTTSSPGVGLGAAASACAALTSNSVDPVQFTVARVARASGGLIGESSDSPGDLALPAGVKQIAVSLDFSCDEFLGGFASLGPITELDGSSFPAFGGSVTKDNHCNNHVAAGAASNVGGSVSDNPGSSLVVNIGGEHRLDRRRFGRRDAEPHELLSVAAQLKLPLDGRRHGELRPQQQHPQRLTSQLADLGPVGSTPAQLTLLPIERSDFVQTEQLITDPKGNVLQDPVTRNPSPSRCSPRLRITRAASSRSPPPA